MSLWPLIFTIGLYTWVVATIAFCAGVVWGKNSLDRHIADEEAEKMARGLVTINEARHDGAT